MTPWLLSYLDEIQKLGAITQWSGGVRTEGPAAKKVLEAIGARTPHATGFPLAYKGMSQSQIEGTRAVFRDWLASHGRTGKWTPRGHAFTSTELRMPATMTEALEGLKPTRVKPSPLPGLRRKVLGVGGAPTVSPAAREAVTKIVKRKVPPTAVAPGMRLPRPAMSELARKGGLSRLGWRAGTRGSGVLRSISGLLRKVV